MVVAAAVWLAKRNYMAEALGMVMQFSAYLRPGELSSLRVMGLVFPPRQYTKGKSRWSLLVKAEEVGVPTTTNTFDDSVILESPYTEGFDKWWKALANMRHKGRGAQFERLLPFEQTQFVRMVKTSLEAVGGGVLSGLAYSMRHGGPAWDRYNQFRSVAEVKSRGRWVSDKSLKRYEKHSKIAQAIAKLSKPVQRHHALCALRLVEFLDDSFASPSAPVGR